MGVRQKSDARSDGQQFGQSATDKLGFYGTTPAAQQTVSATVTTTATTGALATDLASLRGALETLGLVTT